MKHIYPLSDVKHLILLQFCNVNTKFNQSPQFCSVSGKKSDEHLPETATNLGKYSVNPDKSSTFCSETFAEVQLISLISNILIQTAIPFSKLESRSCGTTNKTLVKRSQT